MKPITALIITFGLVLLTACGASPEPSDSSGPAKPVSCEVSESTDAQGNSLWHFSERLTSNPVPGDCEEMDAAEGYYLCKPTACLFLPYTGTCPHCPGGGE